MGREWSREETAIIKREWPTDTPLRDILSQLPGRSRSSVCGAANRIGLPARTAKKSIAASAAKKRRPKSTFEAQPMKIKPPAPPPPHHDGEGLELGQLDYTHCRNIIGYRDGLLHRAVYCGAQKYNNTSYCKHHSDINHRDDRR